SAFVGNSHSKLLKETFWLAGTVTLATPAKDLSAAELVIGLRSSCVAQLTSPVSLSVTRTAPPVLGPDSNCGSGFVRDRSAVGFPTISASYSRDFVAHGTRPS